MAGKRMRTTSRGNPEKLQGLLAAVLLLSLFAPACTGSEDAPEAPCAAVVPQPFGLWSEFMSPQAVLEQVPRMKAHGLSLYQNIRSVEIGSPELAGLFSRASCLGQEVRAWLTLPEDRGYWPNEKNADLFAETALALADWIRSSGWAVDWIVVDMEPDLQTMETLMAMLESGDVIGAVELLLSNRDPAAYSQALATYTRMVEDLHARGFKVMVVTFPMVLDDLADGDSGLQDVMNTPVAGIPWDEVSFMAYTTTFSRFLSTPISPYLVYSYGLDAVQYYPDRAALDLGVIGHAGMVPGEGIRDLGEFRDQVGAAKEAGLQRIHAYSLDGIAEDMPDPDRWMEAFQAPAKPVPEQEAVDLFRSLIQWLDRLMTVPTP